MQRCRQVGMAVVTVLALTGALTIATTTVASATPPGLSSIDDINTYLTTNGITNAFWQTGLKNYAGPFCPGRGWTCHAANVPIVQFASLPGSTNLFLCLSPSCMVIQVSTVSGQNGGACLRGDGSASVSQVCEINQVNTGSPNSTNAAAIEQNSQQNQASVIARQVARITQENGSGRNIAHIFQVIGQSSNVTTGSQSQNALQAATLDQLTTTGNNTSNITQRQRQSQKSTGGFIFQIQNTASTGFSDVCERPLVVSGQRKNQCVEVVQNSHDLPDTDGGAQSSSLNQAINEQQDAPSTASGTQTQGTVDGGQSGSADQHSSGVSTSQAPQDTKQGQTPTGVSSLGQFQHIGDPRCCQTQGSNGADTGNITQTTNQSSGDNAVQDAAFRGHCDTTGTCHVFQSATINGSTDTNECPAPGDPPTGSCDEVIVCTEVLIDEGGTTQTQCAPPDDIIT